MECLFPGSTGVPPRFDLRIEEFPEKEGAVWRAGATPASPFRVQPYCGAPALAPRLSCADRTAPSPRYTQRDDWREPAPPGATTSPPHTADRQSAHEGEN